MYGEGPQLPDWLVILLSMFLAVGIFSWLLLIFFLMYQLGNR